MAGREDGDGGVQEVSAATSNRNAGEKGLAGANVAAPHRGAEWFQATTSEDRCKHNALLVDVCKICKYCTVL